LTMSPGISLQIGTAELCDFFRNPQNEPAHRMPGLVTHTNPALCGLCDLLWKQSVQLQWLALSRPREGSGVSTSQRGTASRSSSRNPSPVQVSQVCERPTSRGHKIFFAWARSVADASVGKPWPLELSLPRVARTVNVLTGRWQPDYAYRE
jgi:hypothetical protein